MVNDAVRGLVLKLHGPQVWSQIRAQADSPESFVPLQAYDDDLTYRLIAAASDVLHMDAAEVMRSFGRYWISDVASVHYSDLMDRTGNEFTDFLTNLDHMHQRIQSTFPRYRPPSFRVLTLSAGLLQIDYYSHRVGLLPFVIGLFEGLARHFRQIIDIEVVPDASHPMPCKRLHLRYRPQ
jgi:hypothetical protein